MDCLCDGTINYASAVCNKCITQYIQKHTDGIENLIKEDRDKDPDLVKYQSHYINKKSYSGVQRSVLKTKCVCNDHFKRLSINIICDILNGGFNKDKIKDLDFIHAKVTPILNKIISSNNIILNTYAQNIFTFYSLIFTDYSKHELKNVVKYIDLNVLYMYDKINTGVAYTAVLNNNDFNDAELSIIGNSYLTKIAVLSSFICMQAPGHGNYDDPDDNYAYREFRNLGYILDFINDIDYKEFHEYDLILKFLIKTKSKLYNAGYSEEDIIIDENIYNRDETNFFKIHRLTRLIRYIENKYTMHKMYLHNLQLEHKPLGNEYLRGYFGEFGKTEISKNTLTTIVNAQIDEICNE